MSIVRFYANNTQTNPGTGGDIYDLDETIGTPGNLSNNNSSTSFALNLAWQQTVDTTVSDSSFDISVNVSSIGGTAEYRFRIARVDSSNVVQAASSYGSTYSTTGVKTETLTLSTTWNSGDRLRLEMETRRSGGHGNVSVGISVGNTSTYVDADITPPAAYDGRFFLMF